MTAEFNKPYVYFHSWAILIGFINHGYFGVGHQVIRIVNKDKTTEEIEKVICYILLWEYIGCAVGSIISSIAVKLSNKKRLIAGDALIVIFSGFIYFYDTEWVVILCGIFYGFGLGFVITTVPIYLKEMAPKQVLTAILTLQRIFSTALKREAQTKEETPVKLCRDMTPNYPATLTA